MLPRFSLAFLMFLMVAPPGAVGADLYHVYAVRDGVFDRLASTTEATAVVPATASTYAVTAVKDGVESEPTMARVVVGQELTIPCAHVVVDVPPGWAIRDCWPQRAPQVLLP